MEGNAIIPSFTNSSRCKKVSGSSSKGYLLFTQVFKSGEGFIQNTLGLNPPFSFPTGSYKRQIPNEDIIIAPPRTRSSTFAVKISNDAIHTYTYPHFFFFFHLSCLSITSWTMKTKWSKRQRWFFSPRCNFLCLFSYFFFSRLPEIGNNSWTFWNPLSLWYIMKQLENYFCYVLFILWMLLMEIRICRKASLTCMQEHNLNKY